MHVESHPALTEEPRAALPHRVVSEPDENEPCVVTLLGTTDQVVIFDEPEAEEAPAAPEPHEDFSDLLSGLGAEPLAAEEVSPLDLKDREIAELRGNLEMLRPIGEELARVEQLRMAEREEFEARIAELERAAENAQAPTAAPAIAPTNLRDVTRLLSALDSTLTDALSGAPEVTEPSTDEAVPSAGQSLQTAPDPTPQSTAEAEERVAKLCARLDKAREQLASQKQKTAARREEAKQLRAQVKDLERQNRALTSERKKFHAPVRELARRAKQRTKPLNRLIELLGLELE